MSLRYVIDLAHLIGLVKGIKDALIFEKSLSYGDIKLELEFLATIASTTTGGVLRDSLPQGVATKRTR
jgi:hypothetical protein